MLHSTFSRLVFASALLFSVSSDAEEITLFNGKDLAAWTFDTGSTSDEEQVKKEDFWLVQNGILAYRGSLGRGTLRHQGVYEAEYALSLEWRWPSSIASGADIVLHSSAEPDEVGRRQEVRVSLTVDEAGGVIYRGTPDRFETTHERQTDKELERDLGQWNHLQIICRETMITVLVNGQPVNQVTDVPRSQGAIGLGTAPVPIFYRNVKLTRPLGPEHRRAEVAAQPLAAAWAKIQARKKAEELRREQARLAEEQREQQRQERLVAERNSLIQQIRDAVASDQAEEKVAALNAKALPFPRDAREMRFNTTFGTIDFESGSSLKALTAFYLREMTQRGWTEDPSGATFDDDSIELVFRSADGEFELELDERSDYVDVSIDTDGVDFKGVNDPAALAALGIPQPRKALLLQKAIVIPDDVQRLSFDDDSCMFYSTMKLQDAFAYFGNQIKQKGYRESRRPILSSSRNYTEFKRGGVELSVNVFTDPVGSRIILEYDDGKKDPVVPPLPEVSLARSKPADVDAGLATTNNVAEEANEGKAAIDVTQNKGSATVSINGERYVFPHVAAYRARSDIDDDSTSIVFSLKPIPFAQLQKRLVADDHFKFMDPPTFDLPVYLVVQVGEHSTLQLSVPGTGLFRGMRNSIEGAEVHEGRIRGTLQMPAGENLEDVTITASVDAVIMTPFTTLTAGSSSNAQVEQDFVDIAPPMPDEAEDFQRSGTNYSKTYTANVDLNLQGVAEFYRSNLGADGWRATEAPSPEAGQEVLRFRNETGLITIKLKSIGRRTRLAVTKHDERKAKQDGVLPESGKGRLIMANAHSVPVVYTIGQTDYPVKPGAGSENLKDALNYSVGPGTYKIIVKIPGQPPKTERVKIVAGSTWAIVAVPTGGYMAMQLY